VGSSGFIEAIALNFSEVARAAGKSPCEIHIAAAGATTFLASLAARHDAVARNAELYAHDVEIVGGDHVWISEFRLKHEPMDAVIISLATEEAVVGAAMTFSSALGPSVPVIACTVGESELMNSLDCLSDGTLDRPSLLQVDQLAVLTRTSSLDWSFLEDLAQAVHENYLRRERLRPDGPETPSSFVPWDELPEDLREQNRQQVNAMFSRLAEYGLRIAPSAIAQDPPATFTDEQVDVLARREHDRWMGEKIKNGWVAGRSTDRSRRIHQDIVPFDELPPDVAEKDRNPIADIPAIMALAGFRVVRAEPAYEQIEPD